MITMYVTYPGDGATRFDRDYYVSGHVPLVLQSWTRYGLVSCAAFFPSEIGAGTIAIAECKFRDDAALRTALAAPETAHVMADIAKFTDAIPAQSLAGPL